MKRLMALVGAIAMVAGAVVVRARLDDGDTGGSGGGNAHATVVCTTELRVVCEAVAGDEDIEVRVENYWTTVTALSGAEVTDDIDAWVAPAAVVDMVTDERARVGLEPVFADLGAPLGRSPMVLVAWRERLDPLRQHCGGEVSWTCIGESADVSWTDLGGSPGWGSLKPGHANPATSAEGLLVASQAMADRLGTTEYASNDFSDPAVRGWFEQLESTVADLASPSTSPLGRMLSQGVASYDLVGATEAEAVPAVVRSRDRGRLEVLRLDPGTTVDVVVATVADAPGAKRAERALRSPAATTALAESGWRVPGQPLADGLAEQPDIPDDAGTPSGGVLVALRSLWQEVT